MKGKAIQRFILRAIILICACLAMMYACFLIFTRGGGKEAKTKLDTKSCDTDCVIDDEGWVGSPDKLGKQLKNAFFTDTGIQPFVYITTYMPYFYSPKEKQQYAEEWYKNNISNQHSFLLMYFTEKDPNTKGYVACVVGEDAQVIIGESELKYFIKLLDASWFKYSDADEMLVTVYGKYADWLITEIPSGIKEAKFLIFLSCILFVVLFAESITHVIKGRT